jgi:hypothetical protein
LRLGATDTALSFVRHPDRDANLTLGLGLGPNLPHFGDKLVSPENPTVNLIDLLCGSEGLSSTVGR